MGIRVPVHLREAATAHTLKGWASRQDLSKYFHAIDSFENTLAPFMADGHAPNETLVSLLGLILNENDALADHVIEGAGGALNDEKDWLKVCQAASWVILQEYVRRVERGEWPNEA